VWASTLRNGSATGLGNAIAGSLAAAGSAVVLADLDLEDSLLLSFSQPPVSDGCSPGMYPKSAPSDARRNFDTA